MANEIRVRANFVAGQLSSGMLTGDTMMQSAALADLPAIGATEHAAIAFFRTDNAGRITQKEIVYVTAHGAGATTATVTRGREGTTAQAWNAGDRFSHTDTALDNTIICTEATKPAAPFDGLGIYCQDSFKHYTWMTTQWVQTNLVDSGWIAVGTFLNGWLNYDPSMYFAAAYRKIGDVVYLRGLIKSGAVNTAAFNLPAGYRPTRNHHQAIAQNDGTGFIEVSGGFFFPAGDVKLRSVGAPTWASLDGVVLTVN